MIRRLLEQIEGGGDPQFDKDFLEKLAKKIGLKDHTEEQAKELLKSAVEVGANPSYVKSLFEASGNEYFIRMAKKID